MDDSEHELGELRTELARHHRDFGKFVELLDAVERGEFAESEALRRIRNIVG